MPRPQINGEVIIWEPDRKRLSFTLLQRRITAGPQHALQLALQHPAHLVLFDLLQLDNEDLRRRSLHERRALLEQLLAAAPPQLTVCPQTGSREQAIEWLESWTPIGIEGLL